MSHDFSTHISQAPYSPAPSHFSHQSMADPNMQSRQQQAVAYPSPHSYPSPSMQPTYTYPPPQGQQSNDGYRSSPQGSNMSLPPLNLPPIRLQDGQQPQAQPQQPPQPMGSPLPPPQHGMPQYYPHPAHAQQGPPMMGNMGPQFNAMRYQLPPQGDQRVLSGGRHKKEIKRRTKTGCLTCRKRRIKVSAYVNGTRCRRDAMSEELLLVACLTERGTQTPLIQPLACQKRPAVQQHCYSVGCSTLPRNIAVAGCKYSCADFWQIFCIAHQHHYSPAHALTTTPTVRRSPPHVPELPEEQTRVLGLRPDFQAAIRSRPNTTCSQLRARTPRDKRTGARTFLLQLQPKSGTPRVRACLVRGVRDCRSCYEWRTSARQLPRHRPCTRASRSQSTATPTLQRRAPHGSQHERASRRQLPPASARAHERLVSCSISPSQS